MNKKWLQVLLMWLLALASLTAATPHKPKTPPPLRFGIDVLGTQINGPSPTDTDDPAPLKVGVPTVRTDGQRIVGELIVGNPSAKPVRILVNPYGGGFPYGGSTPFLLQFENNQKVVTYVGPQFPPPSPPFQMTVVFPPKAQVLFSMDIGLENYTWQGEPDVGLKWGFHFATAKAPEGKLTVRLPKCATPSADSPSKAAP